MMYLVLLWPIVGAGLHCWAIFYAGVHKQWDAYLMMILGAFLGPLYVVVMVVSWTAIEDLHRMNQRF